MSYTGKGADSFLVIGEAPGEEEDKVGIQFIGKSGQYFRRVLRSFGKDLDIHFWKTNALRCFPQKEDPSSKVSFCRPAVLKEIEELKPVVILLLGGIAVESIIGYLWGGSTGGIFRWAGFQIPCRKWNCWICPTYHPSYVLRTNKDPAVVLWFRKHLENALNLSDRPYSGKVENLKDKIECIMEPYMAAFVLRDMLEKGKDKAFSFDFETSCLKPDGDKSKILAAAVSCEGKKTIAFPVVGDAVNALKQFLTSDVPKIGWNIKFEDRWARSVLGVDIKNWVWDGMLATHVIDNRSDITGLKFQAFVQLGIEPWDKEVESYIDADGGYEENRLRLLNLRDLLLYNGIDALVTYLLAVRQRKLLGW